MQNMNPLKSLRYLFVAALLLLGPALAQAANDKGLFWLAEKDNRSVYLLGSVHLATADFYPLRQQIEQAYADSDALVVEADILAAESDPALQGQIVKESLYQGKRNLRDDLTPEVYRQLQTWLQQRRLPEPLFIRQRPAIATIALGMVEMKAQGLDPSLGIDRHFLEKAKRDNKPVVELEGVLHQLQLLNRVENPGLLLQRTLEQLEDIKTFVPRITGAWKKGDAGALYQMIIAEGLAEHPEYGPLYETLFFRRNLTMAEGIGDANNAHQALFVVVGAGHLVGEKSVIELLKKAGYKLQRL